MKLPASRVNTLHPEILIRLFEELEMSVGKEEFQEKCGKGMWKVGDTLLQKLLR